MRTIFSMAGFFSIPLFLFKQEKRFLIDEPVLQLRFFRPSRSARRTSLTWSVRRMQRRMSERRWKLELFKRAAPIRASTCRGSRFGFRDPGDIRKGRRNEGVQGKHAAKRGRSALNGNCRFKS